MYILALFQYGCPRVFFCFPLGPKIKSGSISKEMLRHVYTRVLEDLGTGFQCSVLSAKIKGLSLLKPTVSGRNCPNTAKHLQQPV